MHDANSNAHDCISPAALRVPSSPYGSVFIKRTWLPASTCSRLRPGSSPAATWLKPSCDLDLGPRLRLQPGTWTRQSGVVLHRWVTGQSQPLFFVSWFRFTDTDIAGVLTISLRKRSATIKSRFTEFKPHQKWINVAELLKLAAIK